MMNEFGSTSNYLHEQLTALNLQFNITGYPGYPNFGKKLYHSQHRSNWIAIVRYKSHTKIFDSANLPIKKYHPQTRKILKKVRAKPMQKFPLQTAYSFAYGNYCLHAIFKFHMLVKNITLNNKPLLSCPSEKNDSICASNVKKMEKIIKRKNNIKNE